MDQSSSVSLTSWGLDPLFWSCRKMLIADIHKLVVTRESQGMMHFALCGRPVQKVAVCGVVVAVAAQGEFKVTFHVDDGTAVIRCKRYFREDLGRACEQERERERAALCVGALVKVHGTLEKAETNHESYGLALTVQIVEQCLDVNEEALFKLQAMQLMLTVYNQPLELPQSP